MQEEASGNPPDEFREEEQRVEDRSAGFKKELGLTDLVLTQILFIVGLPWVGVAAKQFALRRGRFELGGEHAH